jgi:PAS domain S-box-containing protein
MANLTLQFKQGNPEFVSEFVEHIPLPFAIFDNEMCYLAANSRWRKYFSSKTQEENFIGKQLCQLHPKHVSHFADICALCSGKDQPSCIISTRADKIRDANHRFLTSHTWQRPDGATGGVCAYAAIAGEQANIYDQLAEKDALVKSLFNKSQIGMNLCQMDGLWLESNNAFLEIIGYSQEEAAGGLTYWDLTPQKYDADEAKQLQALAMTKRYGPYEKEFIRKDGSLVPVRLNGFIVEQDGKEYIWSLIEDISQRKELEDSLELERLKALHAARLASVGELAAGIAHEINNPLAIVDGYLNNLDSILKSGNTELLQEAISRMKNATGRAVQIVRGLKKFSHDNHNKESEPLMIADIISDSIEFFESQLRNQKIDLVIENSSEQYFLGNRLELSQVVMNLIQNAMDALQPVSSKCITLSAYDDSDTERVILEVRDSGTGIPEELIEKVFDPFFTTKDVGKGTGLGLSIALSLITSYQGELSYSMNDSQPCFSIALPRIANP